MDGEVLFFFFSFFSFASFPQHSGYLVDIGRPGLGLDVPVESIIYLI